MLLKKPDTFQPPKRGDILFAILSGVAQAALYNLTPSRWKAAWKIILKATNVAADVAAVAAKSLAKARREKTRFAAPHRGLRKIETNFGGVMIDKIVLEDDELVLSAFFENCVKQKLAQLPKFLRPYLELITSEVR